VEAFHKDAQAVISELNSNSTEKQFITVAGDISKPETGADFVAKIVEAFGRLDVFVSNAGVCQFAEFLEYAPSPPFSPSNQQRDAC
jgi:L-rhamnose 1-dehydrogenase